MTSTWLRLITHRFVLIPLCIGLTAAAWNGYVSLHNGGLVRGVVLGPGGVPVAGAKVSMMEKNFTTNSDRGSTRTRADGSFEFSNNRSHNILLRAEMDGVGRSDQITLRLYFRSQNVTLDAPLMIKPDAPKNG